MKGHPEVVEYLKKLLRGELSARDQYFLHSRMYEDLGLTKLYTRINHEMEEETQHADALLRRILMLDGTPDMRPDPFTPGTDVPSMLRADLALEYHVRQALKDGMALCEKHNDYVSRDDPLRADGHSRYGAGRHRHRPCSCAPGATKPPWRYRAARAYAAVAPGATAIASGFSVPRRTL